MDLTTKFLKVLNLFTFRINNQNLILCHIKNYIWFSTLIILIHL